ncbi:uncharacterized protein [Onthophagus taurus]|uniref:uncharacterized protein n=1 Tax=Onthophagus taurus TaxID=166361 RepID=UPI000C201F15|nr:uncharacterized protein LOC111424883 [Onthophagus taurus]
MAWPTEENCKKYNLRKSVSSIGFNTGQPNLSLREARSFTGALEELKCGPKSTNFCSHEHNINSNEQLHKSEIDGTVERGYVTKEIISNQVFLVRDDMLNYRGKRYSLNDIATRWKKDCRMWLWKNKLNKKRNRSVGEIREKIQNLKIPSRSS